jgi:hypothetical protein
MENHLIPPRALADRLAADDEAYIRSGHVPLEVVARGRLDEVRAAMAAGLLPAPAYVLDDGTEMVAADHLALADEAGADLAAAFRARFRAVDDLDALERPFAPLDEHRFGARPTRHRLIDDARARWPWLRT